MSELTPREWQDIEEAKAALRIDAGWPDAVELIAAADPGDPSASPATPPADADSDVEPLLPSRATPEAQGVPTAG